MVNVGDGVKVEEGKGVVVNIGAGSIDGVDVDMAIIQMDDGTFVYRDVETL